MQVTAICAVAEPVKEFALVVIVLVAAVVCVGHVVVELVTVIIVHVTAVTKSNSIGFRVRFFGLF